MLLNYFHRNLYKDSVVSILEVVELDDTKSSVVSNYLEIGQESGVMMNKYIRDIVESKIVAFLNGLLNCINNRISTTSIYWRFGNKAVSSTISLETYRLSTIPIQELVHILIDNIIKEYKNNGINISYDY